VNKSGNPAEARMPIPDSRSYRPASRKIGNSATTPPPEICCLFSRTCSAE